MHKSKKWINRGTLNIIKIKKIFDNYGLSMPMSAILWKRGLFNVIDDFLSDDAHFYSPSMLPDAEYAVELIFNTIRDNNDIKIAIINDYDVDGATSGIIMKEALDFIGACSYIMTPDRNIDGYGISFRLIDEAIEKGCSLIVTTDNGISAIEQIKYAKEKGLSLIITDHHEVPFNIIKGEKVQILPDADAIVNPKRYDSIYPFKDICGAMVAYKVSELLLSKLDNIHPDEYDFYISRWGELAGIATVCDMMPLISENRAIVKQCLSKISNGSSYVGIRQLIKVLDIDVSKFNSFNIGFGIGPCINACGRMTGNIDLATSLLLEKDYKKAEKIAITIKDLNEERKKDTYEGEKIALDIIKSLPEYKFYVLNLPDVNPHILGIIAGRIKEITNRPCICVTEVKDGILKGSGRSISGYDMFNEMSRCKDLFLTFGGHESAVGVSFSKDNFEKIVQLLNKNISSYDEEIFDTKEYIDIFLPMGNVTYKFIDEISLLEPFGEGNPYPCIVAENVTIIKLTPIGKNKEYLRIKLLDNHKSFDAVYFGSPDELCDYICEKYDKGIVNKLYAGTASIPMNVLYRPSINKWNGNSYIQYQIKDFKH